MHSRGNDTADALGSVACAYIQQRPPPYGSAFLGAGAKRDYVHGPKLR